MSQTLLIVIMALVRSLTGSSLLRALTQSAYCSSQRAGYKALVTRGVPEYATVRDELFEFSDQHHIFLFKANPILFQKHGFSRVTAARVHRQCQVDKKSLQGSPSPGLIFEAYRVRPHLPFFKRWFTREGWEQIRESLVSQLKTILALNKVRQIAGYNQRRIREELSGLYIQFWKACLALDPNAMRPLVTEQLLSDFKKDIKGKKFTYAKAHGKTVGLQNLRILQARLVAVDTDKASADRGIVQVTLMIISINNFSGFDQNGKLVAGHPDKELPWWRLWIWDGKSLSQLTGDSGEVVMAISFWSKKLPGFLLHATIQAKDGFAISFFQKDILVFEINLGAVKKNWRICGAIPP